MMNLMLFVLLLQLLPFLQPWTMTAALSLTQNDGTAASVYYLRTTRDLQLSPEAEGEEEEAVAAKTSCSSTSSSSPSSSTLMAQNTTYNANPLVPPYQGIMFEVFSQGDALEILTLEIDVRLDQATMDDLYIEVYSLVGKFGLFMDNESAWTLHAQTMAIPAPEGGGGVIIPRHDFVPIAMQPRERRSFYIRMNGPWLDHSGGASNSNALIKTGEIFLNAPDLDFYAGVGFLAVDSNNKFSSNFDKTVDPKFAGVVHYRKPDAKCRSSNTPHITHASFDFLTPIPVTSALMSKVNTIVNDAIDEYIMSASNTVFAQYMTEFGLKRHEMATTTNIAFTGNCPTAAWGEAACRAVDTAMTTHVSFMHLDTLSSSAILEHLYYSPFPQEILVQALVDGLGLGGADDNADAAGAAPAMQQILSFGLNSAWVDFTITLHGVSQPHMDALQQGLWEHATLQFLNTSLAARTDHVTVYSVHVTGQEAKTTIRSSSTRRRRFLQEQQANSTNNATATTRSSPSPSSIQLTGYIAGAQNAYTLADQFAHQVALAIKDEADLYLSILQASILRPYQDNDTGLYDYFVNVTSITGNDIVPGNPPPYMLESQQVEEEKQVPILPIAIVLGILGCVVLVAAIYYCRKYRIEKAAYKKELQEYRQEMKRERQAKRRAAAAGAAGGIIDDPSLCGTTDTVQTGSNGQQQQPNGNDPFVPCSNTTPPPPPPPPAQASSSSLSRTSKNSSLTLESQSAMSDTNKIPALGSSGAQHLPDSEASAATRRQAKEQQHEKSSTSTQAQKRPPSMTPGRSKSFSSGDHPSSNKELSIRGIRSVSPSWQGNLPLHNSTRQAPGRSHSDNVAGAHGKDSMLPPYESKSNRQVPLSSNSDMNPRQPPRHSKSFDSPYNVAGAHGKDSMPPYESKSNRQQVPLSSSDMYPRQSPRRSKSFDSPYKVADAHGKDTMLPPYESKSNRQQVPLSSSDMYLRQSPCRSKSDGPCKYAHSNMLHVLPQDSNIIQSDSFRVSTPLQRKNNVAGAYGKKLTLPCEFKSISSRVPSSSSDMNPWRSPRRSKSYGPYHYFDSKMPHESSSPDGSNVMQQSNSLRALTPMQCKKEPLPGNTTFHSAVRGLPETRSRPPVTRSGSDTKPRPPAPRRFDSF